MSLGAYSMVTKPESPQKPYWEQRAGEQVARFPEFKGALLGDWRRTRNDGEQQYKKWKSTKKRIEKQIAQRTARQAKQIRQLAEYTAQHAERIERFRTLAARKRHPSGSRSSRAKSRRDAIYAIRRSHWAAQELGISEKRRLVGASRRHANMFKRLAGQRLEKRDSERKPLDIPPPPMAAIKAANERLDTITELFKFGDFRVDESTNDQLVNDYANAKSEQCIKLLASWQLGTGTLNAAAELVRPLLNHHGLDTAALDDLGDVVGLQAEADRLTLEIQRDTASLNTWLTHTNALPLRPRGAPRWAARMTQRHTQRLQAALDKLTAQRDRIASRAAKIPGDCSALLMRVQDPKWWVRKIRRVSGQRIEAISRDIGVVHRAQSMYCSRTGRAEYRRRKQLNLDMMEGTVIENDDGDRYTLADVAELGNANPMIRRTELMIRVAGFEQYAKTLGYEGWFYTVTCPGAYHAYITKKNATARAATIRNRNFIGISQRDCQAYLCDLWAKFRAKAKRQDWRFFGVRVAEPHHDGTPHWHLLLFVHPDDAHEFGGALRQYAMKELPDEPGADKHRFDVEKIKTGINPKTGKEYSAAGYIAKYISKSIDGEHLDTDLYGEDAKTSAESIVSWASRNGIRQFQQIGGPSVSAWREFRRLARMTEEEIDALPAPMREATKQIEHLNQTEGAPAAWAWYCQYCDEKGKVSMWRIVKTATEVRQEIIEAINEDTGEIVDITQEWTEQRPLWNQYNELIEKDHGIKAVWAGEELHVQTRFKTWTTVLCTPSEANEIREARKAERAARLQARQAQREARAAVEGAPAPPWTGVNNCTGGNPDPKTEAQLELTI